MRRERLAMTGMIRQRHLQACKRLAWRRPAPLIGPTHRALRESVEDIIQRHDSCVLLRRVGRRSSYERPQGALLRGECLERQIDLP
jgi:hypothetical protein